MKTFVLAWIAFGLCLIPTSAQANGVALELGIVWTAPAESAFRAVEQRADTMSTIGLGGAWTAVRIGDFRVDALVGWGVATNEAAIGSTLSTDLLEHAFVLGGRLRWARLYFVQPFVALRAGPAFAWLDVAGERTLESFDAALRIEPAAGFEAFFPFSGLGGRLPHALDRPEGKSGWAGAGIGIGLDVGYRFQTAYQFDAAPEESDDEDVAADAIDRDGPALGELSLSGVRMGINLTVRF